MTRDAWNLHGKECLRLRILDNNSVKANNVPRFCFDQWLQYYNYLCLKNISYRYTGRREAVEARLENVLVKGDIAVFSVQRLNSNNLLGLDAAKCTCLHIE